MFFINLINNAGERRQPGESGGNLHIICNQIINGQKWTIVSDLGNGSDGYKWTREEFEKSFPFMSTGDREENMKTVLTTLKEILPNENRSIGRDIIDNEDIRKNGNFFIKGRADNGRKIMAQFYNENNNKKESLIFIQSKIKKPKNN